MTPQPPGAFGCLLLALASILITGGAVLVAHAIINTVVVVMGR